MINRVGGPFKPKYAVLGSDVAGVVEAVGSAVTRFRPGDEVFGEMSTCGFGAFAEYISAPEGALAMNPAALAFEQATAVPQAGGLAVRGLVRWRPVEPGHQVLINGADHVIDFAEEDFTRSGKTYDLILDIASHRSMSEYRRSLTPRGMCALLTRLLEQGSVVPVVDSVFRLAETAEAVRHFGAQRHTGKIVITV